MLQYPSDVFNDKPDNMKYEQQGIEQSDFQKLSVNLKCILLLLLSISFFGKIRHDGTNSAGFRKKNNFTLQ